jgi:hypothetical protein
VRRSFSLPHPRDEPGDVAAFVDAEVRLRPPKDLVVGKAFASKDPGRLVRQHVSTLEMR